MLCAVVQSIEPLGRAPYSILTSAFRESIVKNRPTTPQGPCKRPQKIRRMIPCCWYTDLGVSEWQKLWCMNHFPSSIKQKTWSIRRKYVFRMDTGFRPPKIHSWFLPLRPSDLCHLLFHLEPELVIRRETISFPIGFILFCTGKRTVLCW